MCEQANKSIKSSVAAVLRSTETSRLRPSEKKQNTLKRQKGREIDQIKRCGRLIKIKIERRSKVSGEREAVPALTSSDERGDKT